MILQEETGLDGDKIHISELFNREIIVKAWRKFDSRAVQGKHCVELQIEIDGRTYVVFTNSIILERQIEQYSDQLPFVTTIKKVNSYYTFS